MTLSHEAFEYVASLVRQQAAIMLEPGKEYLVESRLTPLAAKAGHGSLDAYIAAVRASPGRETEAIVDALTTNETSWFRDATPFTALTDIAVPNLRARRGHLTRLNVWSAACSTGQEPYSIAMTLQDKEPALAVNVLATDLSRTVLERAQAGRYNQLEVNRGLPASSLVKHFTRDGADWTLSDEVRRSVRFAQHNLLLPPPPGGPFDVVFLRNVLIYFDIPTKKAVLGRVREALTPDGYLFLGAAETTVGIDDGWERVTAGRTFIYCPTPTTPKGVAT